MLEGGVTPSISQEHLELMSGARRFCDKVPVRNRTSSLFAAARYFFNIIACFCIVASAPEPLDWAIFLCNISWIPHGGVEFFSKLETRFQIHAELLWI